MSHISLGVMAPNKNADKGAYVANYYEDGKARKSKTVALHIVEHDIAFQTVDLWAEDKAKEMDLEYHRTTPDKLAQRLADLINGRPVKSIKKNKPKTRSTSIIGHSLYFKSEIKKAFPTVTAKTIRRVIAEGLKLLDELEINLVKTQENSSKAKSDMARAMYNTFVDTGIDTSIYCNDTDIVNEFKQLQLERKLI